MLLETVQALIRLWKSQVDADAVLYARDDIIEAPRNLPSAILVGPTLDENKLRRTMAPLVFTDEEDGTYISGQAPRLYHLEFDIIVTASTEVSLCEMMAKVARFFETHTVLSVPDRGDLNLTELTPLGGLQRVNLSNLKQASGRFRVEDCPVGGAEPINPVEGKLVKQVTFEISAE